MDKKNKLIKEFFDQISRTEGFTSWGMIQRGSRGTIKEKRGKILKKKTEAKEVVSGEEKVFSHRPTRKKKKDQGGGGKLPAIKRRGREFGCTWGIPSKKVQGGVAWGKTQKGTAFKTRELTGSCQASQNTKKSFKKKRLTTL